MLATGSPATSILTRLKPPPLTPIRRKKEEVDVRPSVAVAAIEDDADVMPPPGLPRQIAPTALLLLLVGVPRHSAASVSALNG